MGRYFEELKKSMSWLGEKPDTIFLGQAVEYPGTAMTNTLKSVDKEKLLEMPVNEEMQMGITVGLSVRGKIPISIYPRWNFLFCAMNQLVNHLDAMKEFSHGEYTPKAIIRTGIGSVDPLDPQRQHKGDFTEAFQNILRNIEVIRLDEPEDIFEAYQKAYTRTDNKSTLLVEYGDYYGQK
jgi:pyruvate/2-oxoglutarate/acetoin dehydrogenase E1 component